LRVDRQADGVAAVADGLRRRQRRKRRRAQDRLRNGDSDRRRVSVGGESRRRRRKEVSRSAHDRQGVEVIKLVFLYSSQYFRQNKLERFEASLLVSKKLWPVS